MRIILTYLKRYKKLFVMNVLSVFGFALAELGIPTIVAQMVDQGVTHHDQGYLLQMGGVIAVISVLGVAGTILLGYCCAKISTSITRDIRNDISTCHNPSLPSMPRILPGCHWFPLLSAHHG